jgi:hypothetical protein
VNSYSQLLPASRRQALRFGQLEIHDKEAMDFLPEYDLRQQKFPSLLIPVRHKTLNSFWLQIRVNFPQDKLYLYRDLSFGIKNFSR